MVIRVFVSGISGNKEVKKRQQRVTLILDSKHVEYESIDIAEPGNEELKDFMQTNSTSLGGTISDPTPRHALPPQLFNDDAYCGDYDQFEMANEIDEMEKFLKLAPVEESPVLNSEPKLGNGVVEDHEEAPEKAKSEEKEVKEATEEDELKKGAGDENNEEADEDKDDLDDDNNED